MDVYTPNSVTDKFLSYLARRNYINSDGGVSTSIECSAKERENLDEVEYSTSNYNSVLYPSYINDIGLAEQQFILLRNWIPELENEQCRKELEPLLMPLLSHMYLTSIGHNTKNACLRFLKRLSSNLITSEWKPFVEQLITVHTPDDVLANMTIFNFRSSRYQFNISQTTLTLLRRCLASRKLHLIIPVLHHWFDVNITGDDDEEEFDSDVEREKSSDEASDKSDEDSDKSEEKDEAVIDNDNDKIMLDLITTINRKRLESTPPPPLLLYTAHKTDGIVCGRVSTNGRIAATGDQQSQIKIWRLGETRLVPQFNPDSFKSVPLGIHTDFDYTKIQHDKKMWVLRGHSDTVYDLGFLSNDEYLISSSFDTEMRLWKLADFSCTSVYRGHSSPIWGVAVSPITNYVATASHDKTARLWCLDRTYPLRILAGHTKDVTCVSFHPNGTYIASGSSDKTVRLWSILDGNLVRVFGGHSAMGDVHALTFSPNGQYVASAGTDACVWIWDIASGVVVFKLQGHEKTIVSIDWSHDGSTVSAASSGGAVLLWSLDNEAACTDNVDTKRYVTNSSIILSVQYSRKNSLIGLGLK